MKSVYNFVVKPIGKRYNNVKKIEDKELIINTEIFNHQYVNREATVISKPIIGNTDIDVGAMLYYIITYLDVGVINMVKKKIVKAILTKILI